jgi:hypothetical protein
VDIRCRGDSFPRGDVDGAHDVAGGAMPGKLEFSHAALDRGDYLVGDVLANVEAFSLHGGSRCFAGRAIAASWRQGDRDCEPNDQPPRAPAQDFRDRIVDFLFSVGQEQLYSRSWRNALSWRFGWFGYQPRYAAFSTPSPRFAMHFHEGLCLPKTDIMPSPQWLRRSKSLSDLQASGQARFSQNLVSHQFSRAVLAWITVL